MAKKPNPKNTEGFSGLQGIENLMPKMEATFPKPAVDINSLLEPYIKELTNLGPEYHAEMQYLQPYLQGTPTTFAGLEAQSAANATPTGNQSVQAAEANVAKAMESQPTPGFGDVAKAAKQYEGTIPYSQVLQSVLEAGKNQILGYSTVPNLTNLASGAAQTWSPAMQAVVPYLEKSIGYTASGMPNQLQTQIQGLQQPGGYGGGTKTQSNPTQPGVNASTIPPSFAPNSSVNPAN